MLQVQNSQRGAVSIVVALILLFGMTLVAFFAGRSLLFEQRTSANQVRSTKAFEAADAGIEWAIARLNDVRLMSASNSDCVPTGSSGTSFRERYVPSSFPAGASVATFNPTTAQPGCTIAAGGLNCSCPTSSSGTANLNGTAPTFTVTFDRNGIADPESIRITSYGCTSAGTQCIPGATSNADGFSKVTIIAKVRPIVRAAPAAALTTGGWAQVCGSFNIQNTDTGSNGNLVNSGGTIQLGTDYGSRPSGAPNGCGGNVQINSANGIGLTTIPGTPYQNTLVSSDSSLSSISNSSDAMFAAFFGATLERYKAEPTTYVITGSNAASNAAELVTAYNGGRRSFWVDGPLQFSGNYSLGTVERPVMIASSQDMTFNGNGDIIGMVYSDSADWNANGSGNANVRGAVISRVNYTNNGNGSIIYDADVLKNMRDDSGVLVRLPGSWRDF